MARLARAEIFALMYFPISVSGEHQKANLRKYKIASK